MRATTVIAWLEALGLGAYAETFQEQQIDLTVLPALTEPDLKELGIPMGHRKRLLAAIAALGQPLAPAPPPATDVLDPLIAGLPTPLALPLRDYQQETHPVLKLWAACDAVEILLRVLVFLGIGDLSRRGELPEPLRRELRYPIENPTLGIWHYMTKQVANRLPEDTALPELAPLVRDILVPFLDGPERRSSVERSFLALRNRLAHGGGISRRLAAELLANWQGPFEAIWPRLIWLTEVDFVVRGDTGYGRLRGPSGTPEPLSPTVPEPLAAAFAASDGVMALRGDRAIPLWPLTLFGIPQHPERGPDPAGQPLPQVYVRRGEVNLEYTPLGGATLPQSESDETAVERFLALFQTPAVELSKAQKGFSVPGFEESFGGLAKNLRGRTEECETLRATLAQVSSGILWLDGPAGMGKSYLMADLAHALLTHPPDDTLVLGYQFKASDQRCGREPFLRFAIERLRAWLLPAEEDKEDEKLKDLDRFKALLDRLGERRVLFLLDGLDEIAERDPRFVADIPLGVQGPTLTWLCAGRPERGLPEAFAAAGALRVFPDGLPPMHAGDVRTLLLERIGPLRKKLLRQDTEEGERIGNPFVDKVTRLSEGLPLYVKYVIDDIHAGRYRVLDAGEALPPGLHAYHEELLRRLSVGSLHQVLTPIAATLAVAKEPLATTAMADLLRRRGKLVPEGEAGLRLVQQGLGAIASMLRRARTPEGEDGLTLYHHSLAQHMAESAHCRDAVATAREFLADLAEAVPEGPLAPYLFRRGIAHLLEIGRVRAALALLTRFDYLMARLQALEDPDGVQGIGADWRATLAANPELDRDTRLWESFWREREHILRRGDERWPAYKILLQLAVEHADDSPVTREAEAWLASGHCGWAWLRNPQRVARAVPDPCLRVLEGHTEGVRGAQVLPDGRILSWSKDHTLRLWDGQSGAALATLVGHTNWIEGALLLPDRHILSWCFGTYGDHTLRLWDGWRGAPLAKLAGHTDQVNGAKVLPDGRILSWSDDYTLRLWEGHSGAPLATLAGHSHIVLGAHVLPDGRILSWSDDGTLRLWDDESGAPLAILAGNRARVYGAQVLPDGRILSWSEDRALRLWDGQSGAPLATLAGHTGGVTGAQVLPGGRILSWSNDHTLGLWDGQSGAPLATLAGHTGRVTGAQVLPDGRIVSWSDDHTLRLWDGQSGAPLATLARHTGRVTGAQVLPGGRIVSWSEDRTLCLWHGQSGAPVTTLSGHTEWVAGAQVLPGERILSWSEDGTLRLWDGQSGAPVTTLAGHTGRVTGAQVLPGERILSWSNDHTLGLWDGQSGAPLATLAGHTGRVTGAQVLPDGRIVSWSDDHTLRLWDGQSGAPLATLAGHTERVGGVQVLADGRILSQSFDGTLRLWDGRSGAPLATLAGQTEWVVGVRLLPDGRILSWSKDHTLRLWDGWRGAPLAKLAGHTDQVNGAKVLPDGRILSWSDDYTLRLWEGHSGAPLATLAGHSHIVLGAHVLPDGRILSWSADGTLRLWDGRSGAPLATLAGHAEWVVGVRLLPDGRILSWSSDGTLRLWDGRSGSPLAVLTGHTDTVDCAQVLPDGDILSRSCDGTMRLWDGQSGTPLATLAGHRDLNLHTLSPLDTLADYIGQGGEPSGRPTEKDLPRVEPTCGILRTESVSPTRTPCQTTRWCVASTCGLTNCAVPTTTVCWQGTSRVWEHDVLIDGILVVTLESGHVFCLQLYRGTRRITIQEYEDPQLAR